MAPFGKRVPIYVGAVFVALWLALASPSFGATTIVAACDGVTDDAPAIDAQLASMSAGGEATLPTGTCLIGSTVTIPSGVTLAGQGRAMDWHAIGPAVTPVYATRLKWIGPASGVMLAPKGPVSADSGIAKMTIDGNVALAGLASSPLKAVLQTSSLGFAMDQVNIQNVGTALSFEPNFAAGSPNNLIVWGHYTNVKIVNVGSCAAFSPNGNGQTSGGTTNNFFYDFVCYSYYNIGLNFVAMADDNRFDGLYVNSGIANSTGVVFNSGSPATFNGVYSNDMLNAEIDNTDTTGTQHSIVVNNSGPYSSVFHGLIGNEGSFNDPLVVNVGGGIYYWDTIADVGPTLFNNGSHVGLYAENEVPPAAATPLTSNVTKTVLSIWLTPGEWDVCADLWTAPSPNSNVVLLVGAISTTQSIPAPPNGGGMMQLPVSVLPGLSVGAHVGCRRYTFTASTVVYLVTLAQFGGGGVGAYGHMGARRVN